jgi:hypothetical protein
MNSSIQNIIAPFTYRPTLPEKHITKQNIVWHRSFTIRRYYTWADFFSNDKIFLEFHYNNIYTSNLRITMMHTVYKKYLQYLVKELEFNKQIYLKK